MLDTLSEQASNRYARAKEKKETIRRNLINRLGGLKAFKILKSQFHNKRLSTLVQNSDRLTSYYIKDQEIIYLRDPVFRLPDSKTGRGHYFAPAKFIGNLKINTLWFNTIRIWLGILLWYILLYFDVLNKILSYFESIRLRRIGRRRFLKLFGLTYK